MKCPQCNAENSEWALNCALCQCRLREVAGQPAQNNSQSAEEKPKQNREPALAAILSFVFMGLGQAYNSQRKKAYLFFFSPAFLAVSYLILLKIFNEPLPEKAQRQNLSSPSYLILLISSFSVWAFNIYDAYKSAKRINQGELIAQQSAGRSAWIFLRSIILSFVIFFVLLLTCLFLLLPWAGRICKLKQKPGHAASTALIPPVKQAAKYRLPQFSQPVKVKQGRTIEGILYSENNPAVIINGKTYFINDSIRGGRIINIYPDRVKIEFADGQAEYRVGSSIPDK